MPTQFQQLANVCTRHHYRLLLCLDRDHVRIGANGPAVQSALSLLEIREEDGEPLVRIALREHRSLEDAASVALTVLLENYRVT